MESIGGYLVSIVSNLFGYGAVANKLRGKLDTQIYQHGAKNIWDAHNVLRDRVTTLEGDTKRLEKDVATLQAELRQLREMLIEKVLKQ